MREIKFRLWNPNRNGYHYDVDTVMDCLKQQISRVYNHEKEYGGVFEQYTGLKDKNSVEIYEGDILNVVCNWDSAHMQVLWEGSQFVLKTYDAIGFKVLDVMNNIEVIGNIHEQEAK